MGLPPAAKLAALYQADSRIVKGSRRKTGAESQKSEAGSYWARARLTDFRPEFRRPAEG